MIIRLKYDVFKDGIWHKIVKEGNNYMQTLSSQRWCSINRRCGKQSKNPKSFYFGSINGFKNFQEFCEWSVEQYGYSFEDTNGDMWSLDKDILFPGNKIYSVNTCCFVPNRVNKFFTSRKNYRSKYGIGVYKQKESNTYFSLISVNAESKSSFGYTTPFDA